MKKTKNTGALIALSLVFLFNPSLNIIDIMPDFVAYFALISAIGTASAYVPYLSECKDALVKLAIISLARTPAMLIMFSNMYTGRDIVPLFTLIFSVTEIIFLIPAINNGYAALCYLGERTDATALISAFPINRGGKQVMKTDVLKNLTLLFVSLKAALGFLPEICLLTFEDYATRKRMNDIYPALLVLSVLSVLVIGSLWLSRARKYLKAVRNSQSVEAAISSLIPNESTDTVSIKDKVKRYNRALTTLAIASLFTFDITFSNLSNISILPHFIYGIILFCSIFSLTNSRREKYTLAISSAVFITASVIASSVTSAFFKSYTYEDIYYLTEAKAEYTPVKIFGTIEAVAILNLITVAAIIFILFIRREVFGKDTASFGRVEADRMKNISVKGALLFALTALINLLKCVNVYLKSEVIISYNESSLSPLTYSPLPWLATVITVMSVLLVFYSFYFTSEIKSEIKFKYSLD